MKSSKSHIHTIIGTSTKNQWQDFLKKIHHGVRGNFGPELELAMLQYMRNYQISGESPDQIHNKSTLSRLQILSNEFQGMPSHIVPTTLLKKLVKRFLDCKDSRTIDKYVIIILNHCEEIIVAEEAYPKLDLSGFCSYVDRLIHQDSNK